MYLCARKSLVVTCRKSAFSLCFVDANLDTSYWELCRNRVWIASTWIVVSYYIRSSGVVHIPYLHNLGSPSPRIEDRVNLDGSTFSVNNPWRASDHYSNMKKWKLLFVLSSVCCLLTISALVYVSARTSFFQRVFAKLGWVQRDPSDKPDYWCIRGWNNTLDKLELDVDVVFYGNSITCGSSFQDYFPEVSICNSVLTMPRQRRKTDAEAVPAVVALTSSGTVSMRASR